MTPWTVAHQAPLSMEFPRLEYWSGLPFPSQVKALSYFNSFQMIKSVFELLPSMSKNSK